MREYNAMVRTVLILAGVLVLSAVAAGQANDCSARRVGALKRCQAISPDDYQSALLFNPEGYRSYYMRSDCFQHAAVEFRDSLLCDQVRRRWSLLWSSWGVSEEQCRKLVTDAATRDRTEIENEKQLYNSGAVRLKGFRVERNGNGRDFDFIPEFGDGQPHAYTLTFEIVGSRPVLLHSNGYHVDANSNLRIYVRHADIRQRFPEFELNHPYTVRATLTLDLGRGGLSGCWSEEFVEKVFPAAERSQAVTIESRF